MAHTLIASASPTQRRIFAAVLKAARHHVVTTNDAALTLAALHETAQPLIVLLGELLDPLQHQHQSRLSASDVLIHALEPPRRTAFDPQRTYILLTQQPPDALPARVRTHLASRRVALLSPNCTISDLLGAVEDAIARLEATRTLALSRAVLAIAFQQRMSEAARRHRRLRQTSDRSAKHGYVIASLQRTKSSAQVQLDNARVAIDTTRQLLRDVEKRTCRSWVSSQSAYLTPSTSQMHAI